MYVGFGEVVPGTMLLAPFLPLIFVFYLFSVLSVFSVGASVFVLAVACSAQILGIERILEKQTRYVCVKSTHLQSPWLGHVQDRQTTSKIKETLSLVSFVCVVPTGR
jgi:hypothetical protein